MSLWNIFHIFYLKNSMFTILEAVVYEQFFNFITSMYMHLIGALCHLQQYCIIK